MAVPRRILSLLLLALPLAARALCTSDGVRPPEAVLERFVSADCAECWRDPQTPRPATGTLAIDWVVPGARGDAAPLSAVALDDALERLQSRGQQPPKKSAAVFGRRSGEPLQLRLAQGEAFNDYVGTSMELRAPGRGPWRAWLLLVEELPPGTEGSPVARNLVRNVFRPDWDRPLAKPPARLVEERSMQIHEGAQAPRLRLVSFVEDARGRMRAISRTECP